MYGKVETRHVNKHLTVAVLERKYTGSAKTYIVLCLVFETGEYVTWIENQALEGAPFFHGHYYQDLGAALHDYTYRC